MKKRILMIVAITGVISFTSCKKKGCTDELAENYNQEAKKDNYSCYYQNIETFWFDQAFADSATALGYSNIYVELAGEMGSTETQFYKVNEPICGSTNPGLIYFKTNLGSNNNRFSALKIYTYNSLNQTVTLYYKTNYELKPGCHNYQIKF